MRFEPRSSLPTSAACVVANGVRETLGSVLGAPISVRLFEPVIPDPPAWQAIAESATLYRVRGTVADAGIILRPDDAAALVGAVFGEPPSQVCAQRALSPIELDVADRIAGAIAANLAAVCGAREASAVERVAGITGFVTFFELIVEKPVEARIGIALSREPSPEPRGCVELGHLGGVRIAAVASLDLGTIQAAEVARLAAGSVVPLRAGALRRCSLTCYGRGLARGTCGIRNGRFAFAAEIRETA
jgi:hypothetical protein